MQARASLNYIRVAPRKARLVINQIRGLRVTDALTLLRTTNKRIAPQIEKVLQSAVANAENTGRMDVYELVVREAYVNEGPRLKRLRPAPMGRAHRYIHRLAHIILVVDDGRDEEPEQQEEVA